MPIFTSDLTSRGIIYADTITTNSNEDLTLNPAGTGSVVANARLKVNEISADDSSAVSIKSPLQLDSTLQIASSLSVANLTISNGSITDSSGTITFDNENLTTTGNITGADLRATGNLQVDGDLTVSGTTTSVNSTNITVSDPLIILSETNSGGTDIDSGIMIERGSAGNNAVLYWNEGDDKFKAVLTTSNGTATSITDTSVATLVADIESSGTSIFANITVNQIGANDSSAVSITSPLQTTSVQSTSYTAGTLTISDGSINDTDGAVSFNNINIDSVSQATISTVITNVIESADSTSVRINDGLQVDGPLDSGGFFTINGGAVQINAILDEDNMASNSATALATQQSIKAYIDSNSGGTLPIGDSASNSGSVSITNSEELVFRSGDSITATVAGNGVTFDLNETITVDQINAGDSTAITVGSPLLVESTLFVNQINSLDSTSIGLQTDVQVTGSITVSDIITSRNSITGTDVIAQGSLFAGFITSNSNENITLSPGGTGLLNFYGAYTFPTDDGVNGQVLITDGAGTLSFGSTTAATQWTTVSNTDVDSAVEQIDAWSATTYQSAMYNYSIANSDATEYQTGTLHVVHDGTTAYFSEYGKVITGNNDLITFSVGLSGGSVLLYGSAQTPNSNFTSKRLLHLAPGAVSVGSGDNGVLTVRTDDTGRLDVTLAQQEFTVSGGNSISTSSDSSALTIGLDANITVNQIGARDSTSVSVTSPVQLDSTLQVAGTLSVANLSIYTDGSHSYIQESGSGALQIRGTNLILDNADGSNRYAYFLNGGKSELYYNNSAKFETTSTGVKVSGNTEVTGSVITDTITTSGSNSDINISANGTGAVVVESLQIQGNTITATDSTQIGFGQQQLTDVADPTQASDAATKSYVDTQVSGIESGVSAGFAIAMSIAL